MRWLVLMLLLAGCTTFDRPALVKEVNRITDKSFEILISADAIYREDSTDAEQTRMKWIQHYLDLNKACANGFNIDDRQAVKMADGVLGDGYRITYQVSCK